jgi:hypothetical protein
MKNWFVSWVVGFATGVVVLGLALRQLHLTSAVAQAIAFTVTWIVQWPYWRNRAPEIGFVRYAAGGIAGGLFAAALGIFYFK